MASSSLRSDLKHWLLWKPISQLSTARLPRCLDVLQLFEFHHITEGRTLLESYKMACHAVICIWMRARIPTQRVDSRVRKLSKLYQNYVALKVHRTWQRESDRMTCLKVIFKNCLIMPRRTLWQKSSRKKIGNSFECKENTYFPAAWVKLTWVLKTAAKESRQRQQQEKDRIVKVKYKECTPKGISETEGELSAFTSSQESEEDDEYQPFSHVRYNATAPASSLKKETQEHIPVPWSCWCFGSCWSSRPWCCVCSWSCCTGAWPWHFRIELFR